MNRMAIGVIVLLVASGTPQVWAQSDSAGEFIWRDRWTRMGWEFQVGYALGVYDAVRELFVVPRNQQSLGQELFDLLRRAHACASEFTTVRAATVFAGAAMGHQKDPQIDAARVILSALSSCAPLEAVDLPEPIGSFAWKDRWDDWAQHPDTPDFMSNLEIDGYVAGIIDLVRHLDNAGKEPATLRLDVNKAALCSVLGKVKIKTAGDLRNFVGRSIEGPTNTDPLQSMAGAIFEALRRCGQGPQP